MSKGQEHYIVRVKRPSVFSQEEMRNLVEKAIANCLEQHGFNPVVSVRPKNYQTATHPNHRRTP